MTNPRPTPPPETERDAPGAFPREDLAPPFYATLTVGQGVDDRTAAEAGANPEAKL